MKEDEGWFEYVGCALDVLKIFSFDSSCRSCSLLLAMEIENQCFQDPANNSLYSVAGEKRSLTGASSVDFLCQISHICQVIM